MKIICQIRRTKDYYLHRKYSTETFGYKERQDPLRIRIFAWNICFKMRYMDFRQRLSDIAITSIKKNNFDDILMYFDEDNVFPIGSLVVPIDEDDWFSPYLVENIKKISEPYTAIYWDEYVKDVQGVITDYTVLRCPPGIIDSCCYGLRSPYDISAIKYHRFVKKSDSHYIPKMLSLKIETPSGIFAQKMLKIDMTVHNFKNYLLDSIRSDIKSTSVIPKGYEDLMVLYKDLLRELLESKIVAM